MSSPQDDAPSAHSPREQRSSLFLAAVLQVGSQTMSVKIRNMSPSGALIELADPPLVGSLVNLARGTLAVAGQVRWSSGTRCGVSFRTSVIVKEWVAAPTKVEQHRVDHIVALVKAGAVLPDETPATDADARNRVGLDIDLIIRLLRDLEDDLAESGETLSRHGEKMQNLDIAMQMLRAVAAQLAPADVTQGRTLARLPDLRRAGLEALRPKSA